MDVTAFFTRLLQSAPKEPEAIRGPDDDHRTFDATWRAVQETLQHPDERQIVRGITHTDVPSQLQLLVDTLVNESNKVEDESTGPCLEYFLKHDLLGQLELLSEVDRPHGIKREVLNTVNNLIILLPDRLLAHNAVHRPLRRLLRSGIGADDSAEGVYGKPKVYGAAATMHRRSTSITGPVGEDYEADLVDLMCTLCSKMRAYPPLLLIFFHDKGWIQPHPSSSVPAAEATLGSAHLPPPSPTTSSFTSRTQTSSSTTSKQQARFEFLLFSYLLRFVHREGRIGDFARAGLLFLFDIAFLWPGEDLVLPEDQEESLPLREARGTLAGYILDGEFAEVMAATLGAVYSVLPRKLRIAPMQLAFRRLNEDAEPKSSDADEADSGDTPNELGTSVPLAKDPAIRAQLDHFLKLFGFLQDITRRCSGHGHGQSSTHDQAELVGPTQAIGAAVSSAVVQATRVGFLDNILYPSILESSPSDDSSVAVMTYLDALLSSADDGPLLSAVLDHLSGADDERFSLKDLILENIESGSSAASATALRLASTLLSEHCSYAVEHVLLVARDERGDHADPAPSATVTSYASLLRRIDPQQPVVERSAGYSAYLSDAIAALEADRCFEEKSHPHLLASTPGQTPRRMLDPLPPKHRLSPEDPVSRAVFGLLSNLLTRSADENLAITSAISALAHCPRRSLSGWLVVSEQRGALPGQSGSGCDEQDSDESDDEFAARVRIAPASDPFADTPALAQAALYQILRDITNQISCVRAQTRDFARLLAERRRVVLASDNGVEDQAAEITGDRDTAATSATAARDGTPPRPGHVASPAPKRAVSSPFGSLRNFFSPQKRAQPDASPLPSSTDNSHSAATTPPRPAEPSVAVRPLTPTRIPSQTIRLDEGSSSKLTGPWGRTSSPYLTPDRRTASRTAGLTGDRPDTPASDISLSRTAPRPRTKSDRPPTVELEYFLDNCIILEEFIKEIVAIINARRALGIDPVDYISSAP